MKQYIYADNAATTKLDEEAFEAMKPFLLDYYGNASQPYSFSMRVRRAMKEARIAIASCIGALPEEIFFTSGGSESNNWAIKGTAFYNGKSKAIVTSQIEHHSILNSCKMIESLGYPVAYVGADENGVIQPEKLKNFISSPSIVSIMMANNEIGSVQMINNLAEIVHSKGAVFHTDAVQAVGHIPVNVQKLGVDMLSASAHKFNGPKGIGFLYIKKGTPIYPLINGGQQENSMRAGTENISSIVAMAAALKKNCSDMEVNTEKVLKLEEVFLDNLNSAGIDFIRNGSENHIPGNVSVSFKGQSGEMLLHRLDLMGICVSTGSACDSKETQISHVLKAIGLDEGYAKGTIRVSFGKDNTVEEAEKIARSLISIISPNNTKK
ncbi:MAG: cysteine desulfurase [Clostridia bacterium]|nr:cysteine desulfurase [Clostridia bacterium]